MSADDGLARGLSLGVRYADDAEARHWMAKAIDALEAKDAEIERLRSTVGRQDVLIERLNKRRVTVTNEANDG